MDTEPDSSDIDHEDIVKDETSRANNPSSVMRKWKESNSDCNTGFELEGQRFDLHSHLHPKKCRPSCYRKRVLVAYCCRLYTKRWYWKVIVRHLPQACVCSNCPCADSSVCTGCYRKYYNV
ncbi:hypothetical protein ACOMHN_019670 [Nucella lapillus]